MIEDMSSRRREWYDETPEPDEPPVPAPPLVTITGSSITARDALKNITFQMGPGGKLLVQGPLTLSPSARMSGKTHLHQQMLTYFDAPVPPGTKYDQSDPDETPREKALRQKKAGHSRTNSNAQELRKSSRGKSGRSQFR